MSSYQLAFIGGGNMAEAVVRGVLSAGLIPPADMIVADPAEGRRDMFVSLGLAATTDNRTAARSAERVLLAVKPQVMDAVLAELAGAIWPEMLVISIAAGVSTRRIEAALRQGPPPDARCPRVVRVMPNTPMLVGAGMSGLVRGSAASEADLAWVRRLFDAAGRTIVLDDEKLLDAVTAVSGSGPAYFFYLVEQMVAAGVAEGLSESAALTLATQTCAGAARLLAESGVGPAELRRRNWSRPPPR